MLTSIEQLEKEIEKFHENVAASNELVRLLKSIADVVTKQTVIFNQQSGSLEKSISRVPVDIKSDYNDMLKRFASEKNSYIEALGNSQKAFSESLLKLYQDILTIPENTMKINAELIDKALDKLLDVYALHNNELEKLKAEFAGEIDTYRSAISDLQKEIKATETNINEKYSAFLSHLETLNIEQVFKVCQTIKRKQDDIEKTCAANQETIMASIKNNINKKMTILYCWFGVIMGMLLIILFFLGRATT